MRVSGLLTTLLAAASLALAAGPTATADVQPMIIGGENAPTAYTFMATLGQPSGPYHCGAALIEPQWVLTAAHCVAGSTVPSVRIGSLTQQSGGEVVPADRVISHPDYDQNTAHGDIALVHLSKPAKSQPVQIAPAAPVGTKSRIMGWGSTCPDSFCTARTLKQLDTSVTDPARCAGLDPGWELCTDNPNGQGACYGDSGGPQVIKTTDGWHLIGITSRGSNGPNAEICAKYPSIYSSAIARHDWIKQQTGRL